jgi:restriction system protein
VIGWGQVGDLSPLKSRDAVRAAMTKLWPDAKRGAISVNAGQVYRFAHEMTVGDFVIYPSKIDGLYHLGRVAGPYRHDPKTSPEYANVRPVEWIRSVKRDQLSLGARHEAGGIMTVFQVRNYADEFLALIQGQDPVTNPEEDPTVAEVKEDIEQTTREYILGKLARDLKGYPLQDFVAELLEAMDYRVDRSGKGADGGIDLVAYQDPLCLEPPVIKVQVKAEEGTAKDSDVAALLGNLAPNERGLFVTLGRFSKDSRRRESQHAQLRLVDGDQLIKLIFEYYERSGTRLKSFLPLKRVYIPDQVS